MLPENYKIYYTKDPNNTSGGFGKYHSKFLYRNYFLAERGNLTAPKWITGLEIVLMKDLYIQWPGSLLIKRLDGYNPECRQIFR